MTAHTQLDEVRRWAKFPATLLFVTCLLWLLAVLPRVAADWDRTVAQPAETFIGAILVFLQLVLVPIASPLAAIGMLFVQRSAFFLGACLPFIPLLTISFEKAARISGKFREYRELHSISSFGDGVLDAVILLGLWLIAIVHVLYIRRALGELAKAEQWARASAPNEQLSRQAGPLLAADSAGGALEHDESCFLLPETVPVDEDD